MNANTFYNNIISLNLECTCVGIEQNEWDRLMKEAKRADKKKVEKLLVEHGHLAKEDIKYYNPYNYFRTDTHLIYVHSMVEHFYKIN